MTRASLLDLLPEPSGREEIIKRNQDVYDIIKEVLAAHDEFAPDYDLIADRFAGGNVPRKLWEFCRENIEYVVEKEKMQTTRSPAVLLDMGFCDCKHYAGFVAGILDALNRSGRGYYNWIYRFAYYDNDEDAPGHVFVVLKNKDGSETWIDPVLSGFDKRTPAPVGMIDKKKSTMTLVRMSGIEPSREVIRSSRRDMSAGCCAGPLSGYGAVIGASFGALDPNQSGAAYGKKVFDNQNLIPGAGNAFLQDPPISFWIGNQQLVLPPPNLVPGAAVPALPAGLVVQYAPSFMGFPIPANMPRPVVVSGNRLQISPLELGSNGDQTNSLLVANNKVLLNVLMSAMGALINSYSSRPYSNPVVNGPGTAGAFNTLSHYILQDRNKDNFLDPIIERTFAGNIINTVANTVLPIVKPIVSTVANVVVPGSGSFVNAFLTAEQNALQKATGQNTSTTINPLLQNQVVAETPGSGVIALVENNPVPALLLGAAVLLGIYALTD